ncbi:MAG: gas vesicle protein K [Candidatus Methanoperedens sp.]|nr:gas vesicle protein K [Candidatus Methanoperedens sp.]
MPVNIDEGNLKQGLLGLVVALVEIIQEVLERQAIRRMEGGRLSDQEIEKLGLALNDLKEALDNIKKDNDLDDAVKSVRDGLDQITDDMIRNLIDTRRWGEGVEKA